MDQADAFDRELMAGAERLEAADVEAAEAHARHALQLRPGNPLAQNLIGLVRFGQGRFEDAATIFDGLTRRNADVISLRINAGLALVYARDLDRAALHLRRAVDLDPSHRRAFAYLAAVHLERGENDFARAALLEAGLGGLAERANTGVDAELGAAIRSAAFSLAQAEEPPPRAWEGFAEIALPSEEEQGSVDAKVDADVDAAFDLIEETVAAAEAARAARDEGAAAGVDAEGEGAPSSLATSTRPARRRAIRSTGLSPAARSESASPSVQPFPELAEPAGDALVDGRDLQLCVTSSLLMRRGLLILSRGPHSVEPAEQRCKGTRQQAQWTDASDMVTMTPAGDEPLRLLLRDDRGRRFDLLRLEDERICVAERSLAAFSGGLRWENGRIPNSDLAVVELLGEGLVALLSSGPPRCLTITAARPARLRADCLLGWYGDVIPCAERGSDPTALVCSGDGVLLLCLEGPGN